MDAPPVQHVKTSDDFNIAFSVVGEGRPVVLVPPLFHHLQLRWRQPKSLARGLAARFQLVMFDARGTGMSTRGLDVEEFEKTQFVRDLEAVVDYVRLRRMVLIGVGPSCHTAVRYAAKHPDKVEALVLISCTMTQGHHPVFLFRQEVAGRDWDALLYVIAKGAKSQEETLQEVEDLKRMVDPSDFAVITRVPSSIAPELDRLNMPTLVIHPREVRTPSNEECAEVASKIPGALMVVTEGGGGTNAVGDEEAAIAAIEQFLASVPSTSGDDERPVEQVSDLSSRELEVLRLLAAGRSNQQIADELVISLNTANRHVSNIYAKTGVANRAEAVGYAHRQGLV
jgi:DNA-binding CsgD family transcriptional regulator